MCVLSICMLPLACLTKYFVRVSHLHVHITCLVISYVVRASHLLLHIACSVYPIRLDSIAPQLFDEDFHPSSKPCLTSYNSVFTTRIFWLPVFCGCHSTQRKVVPVHAMKLCLGTEV
jgi:hypothetical protein